MASYRISRSAIEAYAALSHDRNALHLDDTVAEQSVFGGVVAHGFLLLSDALCALAADPRYPKSMAFQFHSPGRPGDTLETAFEPSGSFRVTCGDRLLVHGRNQ